MEYILTMAMLMVPIVTVTAVVELIDRTKGKRPLPTRKVTAPKP